jgi:4-aminobutyrate--pyruvate transaminase
LIVRAIGDRVAFAPPLIISEAELLEMGQRFATALSKATDALARASAG